MSVFDQIMAAARAKTRSVVLPEAHDERVLQAAANACAADIAQPILLGNASAINQQAQQLGIDLQQCIIVDPETCVHRQRYVDAIVQKRKHKGMNAEKANLALNDNVTYACLMVSEGDAQACVAGADTATATVVSNAMRYVGKRQGEALVSSCFIMLTTPEHPVKDALLIGDCALVIDPDANELAAIAVASGETAQQLLNTQPQVAMLSFSTAGSARHAAVTKVAKACELARMQRPNWRIVGEVQLDAAVVPELLARKDPTQATSEPCNVLIFPNLDAGNIGYKLIERFGGAQAIGPILQGLSKPVNDLSRGCSIEDIVSIIAVSASQVID